MTTMTQSNQDSSRTRVTKSAETLDIRVALLGAGKMGGTLLQAFLRKHLLHPSHLHVTVRNPAHAESLSVQWGIPASTDNLAAVRQSDIILLGVKPHQINAVVAEIRPALTTKKTIISFAASVKTEAIETAAGIELAVVRAMPNTPSLVGCGATALCRGKFVHPDQLALAERIFSSVGRTVTVDEKQMDAVTALAASGPAYMYIILEALAEGGVKAGLPHDTATLLAAQMALGAAMMVLETGSHPALLKDAVTTPAGCTAEGILQLEEGGIRATLIKTVVRAAQRAKELASHQG